MDFDTIQLNGLTPINLYVMGASPADEFILKEADGLGPPEVDVMISNTLHQGGVYQGRRPLTREIVLRVGLNPDYSVGERPRDLRTRLYGLLTPGEEDYVEVSLVKNNPFYIYSAKAWVKRIEPAIFAKDPEVQIVLPCLQPFFAGMEIQDFSLEGSKTNFYVTNAGTAPAGFQFRVTFTGSQQEFGLTNSYGDRIMKVAYPFQTGDVLTINTVPGERTFSRNRGGTNLDVSGFMVPNSQWLMLRGGQNLFNVVGGSNFNWTYFNYTPQFWGV